MKKKLFFAAMALVALASCTSDEFVGVEIPQDNSPSESNAIVFSTASKGITRADIAGAEAAALLGSNFYVTGTKGTETATSPTPTLVFDNYLVHNQANTAGTTTSNTANWEYVGVTPGTAPTANYVKLSSLNAQTIKYWDYSTEQYDFLAFSTGTYKAVNGDSGDTDEIGVTAMKYGADLASSGTAYTFDLPSIDALKNAYISDITEVKKENYGKEVTLKFKNLGSKVRVALYETVPGYSVKDVTFYKEDGTTKFTDGDEDDTNDEAFKSTTVALISANNNGIPTKGKIAVYFPHVGNNNASAEDYDKAAATVTPVTASSVKAPTFGSLSNYAAKELDEETGNYLGRSLPYATFAGSRAADYYQTVFPVSSSDPLTLRVDYTLVPIDGAEETIKIYGAKAVVPSTYTKWLPNYAYTYIFKISDNTNGWTSATASTDGTNPGLFPITFDAVVAEATDATGKQATITTVATPSITTYQQGHDITKDEYSIATGKNIYVQVMDNRTTSATLVTSLSATNSLLYAVDADHLNATEAEVMDALEKRTTALDENNVTGRNGVTLTKNSNISNTVTSIVNGVDNNPISVSSGEAAQITISSLATGTYAYVYDYTSGTKTASKFYQPIAVTTGEAIGAGGKKFYSITTDALDLITEKTTDGEAVSTSYIYFSKTTNGTGTTTYSFVSVDGKTTLPAGLLKVPTSDLTGNVDGSTNAVDGTFYFDMYMRNDGKYAVKVIKIVA